MFSSMLVQEKVAVYIKTQNDNTREKQKRWRKVKRFGRSVWVDDLSFPLSLASGALAAVLSCPVVMMSTSSCSSVMILTSHPSLTDQTGHTVHTQ